MRLISLMDWTGKSIWDLGSPYGLFAVGLGHRAGPTGIDAAFEPNPLSYLFEPRPRSLPRD